MTPLAFAALALAAGGCDDGNGSDGADRPAAAAAALPLGPAPERLRRACELADARAHVPLRCATRFIAGVRLDRRLQRGGTNRFYAYEATFTGLPHVGVQHVMFGGQRGLFRIERGGRPRAPDALAGWFPRAVEVIGHAAVRGVPAVVARVSWPSPHAGHVLVTWNEGPASYFASVHLERLPLRRRIATALALARGVGPP